MLFPKYNPQFDLLRGQVGTRLRAGAVVEKTNDQLKKRIDNLVATKDPSTSDNLSLKYGVGSRWFNTNSNTWFVCTQSDFNSAIWELVKIETVYQSDIRYKQVVSEPLLIEQISEYDYSIDLKQLKNELINLTSIYIVDTVEILGGWYIGGDTLFMCTSGAFPEDYLINRQARLIYEASIITTSSN